MLAMMADASTGRCEALQETLAEGCEISERSVRAHLVTLEKAGLIARRPQWRRDRGRRGDEFLLLLPGVTEWPDGESVDPVSPGVHPANLAAPPGTARYPPRGTQAAGQEQPLGNSHASRQEENAPARDPRDLPPDGFPDELRSHAREVLRILRAVAGDHPGARKVWPRAVGQAVMAHPRHPLVATAHAVAIWAVDPPRPIRDVVATYRTFLERERELASPEQLAGDGTPSSAPRSTPDGVTQLRPRTVSELKYLEKRERDERRAEALERAVAARQAAHHDQDIIDGEAREL